jgi:flagellar basal-body rod protein FlgB
MNLIESSSLHFVERFLDLAAYRQTLVASNIANVDTPGYHTRDIDFRQELQKAITGDSPSKPLPSEVPGLMQRPDGNDVSIDREALALAQTQIQFRIGVEMARHEFRMVSTAIQGGGGSSS